MAVDYLSDEWLAQMQEGLKKEFADKGRVTVTFAQGVEGIPGKEDWYLLMTLKDSQYVDYCMGPIDDLPEETQFKVFGDFSVYKGIIEGNIDGSKCLMTGQLSLEGNMVKAVALMGTYNRLESVQRSIETNFPG